MGTTLSEKYIDKHHGARMKCAQSCCDIGNSERVRAQAEDADGAPWERPRAHTRLTGSYWTPSISGQRLPESRLPPCGVRQTDARPLSGAAFGPAPPPPLQT